MRARILTVLLMLLLLLAHVARAEDGVTRTHGITLLGKPALPADFKYFPYVNPDAPKGGEVVVSILGGYDNFNPFVLRGVGAYGLTEGWILQPGGAGQASSVGHVWESLLTASADEIATAYAHLAQAIEYPADRMWIAFELRPEAKFSDGVPVTAEDVVWSFETLRDKGRPSYKLLLGQIKDAVAENPRRVVFHFTTNENKQLPLIAGGLPVLPKHFFDNHPFEEPLTVAPIGSGPYRVASFDLGRSITYERNPDWWARDLPTGRGTNNFDRVRVDFYRDPTVTMEALKAGAIDIRSENIARIWATGYDFPALRDGRVIKQQITHHEPEGMAGTVMNTRRATFQDRRVRQALTLMLDFEWLNKNLMYGAYTRLESYFANSPLAATGLPDEGERALLEPFRDELPPELFSTAFKLPVTDGSGSNREQARAALDLFKQAGWTIKGGKLVNGDGQQMAFTILLRDTTEERIMLPYAEGLRKIGIAAEVRTVDRPQWVKHVEAFDFDMTLDIQTTGDIPADEMRDRWTCAAEKTQGSGNFTGACGKALDSLVERLVNANDRQTLETTAHALDRVLLWNWYIIPEWYSSSWRMAWWDKFGHPDTPIREGFNFDLWWVDPAKVKALAAKQ